VTNAGDTALSDVTVSDSISAVIPVYKSGDVNHNGLLDIDETWIFQAEDTPHSTITNTAISTAKDTRGNTVTDQSQVTVTVVRIHPVGGNWVGIAAFLLFFGIAIFLTGRRTTSNQQG
jgi:hypothetical protein